MTVFLETERLVLRQFTDGDAKALFALDNDPAVMRFLTGGRPATREAIMSQTLPRLLREYRWRGGRGYWAAEEKSGGAFLGWFELRPVDSGSPAVVELGYRLRRCAWGRGYATEGCRALIDKGFTDLGVERVVAETMAVNTASRRVMEKAGLSFVRSFTLDWPEPIAGSEHGEVAYELTRADWQRQKGVRAQEQAG